MSFIKDLLDKDNGGEDSIIVKPQSMGGPKGILTNKRDGIGKPPTGRNFAGTQSERQEPGPSKGGRDVASFEEGFDEISEKKDVRKGRK